MNERPKQFNLVIGPIDDDDGFSPEDRKEWVEDEGWRNVRIEWLGASVQPHPDRIGSLCWYYPALSQPVRRGILRAWSTDPDGPVAIVEDTEDQMLAPMAMGLVCFSDEIPKDWRE